MQATDDDEPGTDNSRIKYRIVQASNGLQNKFNINPDSGVISLRNKIDFESLDSALDGRVLVKIEAFDLGTPSLSTSVNVIVQVEVSLNVLISIINS